MILAHTPAEAQLSWQGLLYSQLCEVNKKPINNVSLNQIGSFIQGLTAVLSRSSNCSSVFKDDPVAANSKGMIAACLLKSCELDCAFCFRAQMQSNCVYVLPGQGFVRIPLFF